MAKPSEPQFISIEDILLMQRTDKNKTTAICKCPLPLDVEIDGVRGGYGHVIKYDEEYTCKNCGLTFSVKKAAWKRIR